MKEIVFKTTDGQKLICAIWDAVSRPVGVVQIIHGMDEHIRRYDRFAKFLNKNGYIVFGDDHRGHGKTAGKISNIGRVGNIPDIFMATVNDEIEILKYLKAKYKLPVFLFGHSYGSFITQRVMECTNLCAAGVCLSGSAKYPIWLLRLAAMLAWIGVKMHGPNAPAKLLEHFSPIRGPHPSGGSKLTRDTAQVSRHDADPMHAKYFSYGFYYSLFHNLIQISYNIDCNSPILIISGGADMVSNNAIFSNALYKTYQAHNMDNLTIIIYPDARHELLMELNYKDVQRDILDFFNSAIR